MKAVPLKAPLRSENEQYVVPSIVCALWAFDFRSQRPKKLLPFSIRHGCDSGIEAPDNSESDKRAGAGGIDSGAVPNIPADQSVFPDLSKEMSIRAIQWAFDQEVFSSPAKFVLVALANFSNESGKSYPGVPTIAKLTNQNPKTVRKALAALVAEGFLSDTGKRFGDTQQVKVYQFPPEACEQFRRLPKAGVFSGKDTLEESAKSPRRLPNLGSNPVNRDPVPEKQERSGQAAPPGFQKRFIALWEEAYQEAFGHSYAFAGAKDGNSASALVKIRPPYELIGIAREAWKMAETVSYPFDSAVSIAGFFSQFNAIVGKLKLMQKGAPIRGQRPPPRAGEGKLPGGDEYVKRLNIIGGDA